MRRQYDIDKKTRIVLDGLRSDACVFHVCRKEGVRPSTYYRWRSKFIEGGKAALSKRTNIPWGHAELDRLREQTKVLRKSLETAKHQVSLCVAQRMPRSRKSLQEKLKILRTMEKCNLPLRIALRTAAMAPSTYFRWRRLFVENGAEALSLPQRSGFKKSENERIRNALFGLLHTPPILHGINRTTWRMYDLKALLSAEKGIKVSLHVIRDILRSAGYKWRKARTVLTSNDPNYKEKLRRITRILSTLGPNDRFFSIDEFGPFAVKKKGGRRLVRYNEYPTIPQWQRSKGFLVLVAALELSTNQVTHFYSKKKDTEEMLRLLDILVEKYSGCRKIYLSWDSASWHSSKKFLERVKAVNRRPYRRKRGSSLVKLAPLPARAQFLNVIESVFSGMAKAIIHNSDYRSVGEAKSAIDRYFRERNEYFRKHPRRAGKKIWGSERVWAEFKEGQNCKPPKWGL